MFLEYPQDIMFLNWDRACPVSTTLVFFALVFFTFVAEHKALDFATWGFG